MRLLTKYILIFFLPVFLVGKVSAFQNSALFGTETPLEIELSTSLTDLKLSESDTLFFTSFLRYKTPNDDWDSVKVELRARGNSRRIKCGIPPIRIKIDPKDAKNTIFEGEKALKLVLPCEESASYDDLIYKEYLCYKFYELLSPYYFQTKLINLSLTDIRGRKSKTHQLVAFLIEDDDKTAKRFEGGISDAKIIRPNLVNDTIALKQDFFSFMIGNTDWSNTVQHNVKIMEWSGKKVVPLPYDFDMAGFVGAPYAKPYNYLPIQTVQERLYRGICRESELVQFVRDHFLSKEQDLYSILETLENEIRTSNYKEARNYISGFFEIIKDEEQFEVQIRSECLPNTY
jgi:hypothetical protein